jgi:hypothetical protein
MQKTLWTGQNKGVLSRKAKDEQQYEQINSVTTGELAQSRRALERKTLEYERLQRGYEQTDKDDVLVDFETKYLDRELDKDVPSEEVEVEIVDEFGRSRKIRQYGKTPYTEDPRPL